MPRYFQQNIVPEMGLAGREKLKSAKVLIVGAGGLGTPVAVALNAAGVGKIGIADGDVVEESNLARQFLFQPDEIGHLKVETLADKLRLQNPDTHVVTFPVFLSHENIAEIARDFDLVCDCTDNAAARLLIDRYCKENQKPLVYAAVRDWHGYVTVFHHRQKVALNDIFAAVDFETAAENCAISGIINTTCGIAGNLQANEVLKIILGLPGLLDGNILCFNSLDMVFRRFRIRPQL
ncbi:HesA/MoeB/ThiF family protein [Flavobacterium caeni]|uniref:Molybdopterin or thiamine biosynthesis adenylyltransferase n=1 Tax=Flavobacterium caeni TaxID=490189 RepID=A0A1G5K4V0_9FLAO|nr:HesA/MoeB/ThiF family protein [Flavobacterium caeni]SCY95484.1 Molybdopterin or thiamine biosynthesis adenylyltransferase [Flavobacterium caeni]